MTFLIINYFKIYLYFELVLSKGYIFIFLENQNDIHSFKMIEYIR